MSDLRKPSGPKGYLNHLQELADNDVFGLVESDKKYGDSWRKRGGIGAFMMLARKWDRIEKRMEERGYDIFEALHLDQKEEGLVDDIRDIRRYLLLVESEMLERGFPRSASKLHEVSLSAEKTFGNLPGVTKMSAQDVRRMVEGEEPLNSGGAL